MSFDNCFYDATGKLVCGFNDCNWKPWSGLESDYTVKCENVVDKKNKPSCASNPLPYVQKYPNQNETGRYVECFTNNCGVRDSNFPKNTINPPYTVSDLLKEDGNGLKYLN